MTNAIRTLTMTAACVAMITACSKTSTQTSSESTTAAASPQAATAATASASPATAASMAAAAPSASATASGTPGLPAVAFTDINGIFAQQAITNEAELGAFASTSGQFRPNDPIGRGDYVKWLVTLNNIYFSGDATKQFRFPETPEQTFVDVPQSSPYWKYVQSLVDAGFVVGVDATHFAPNRLITRQEMVAIKYQVDAGQKATPNPSITTANIPQYVDGNQVAKLYLTAVVFDVGAGDSNIRRIWGKTIYLHPRQNLTRAEAAVSLDWIAGVTSHDAVARLRQP